MNDSLSQPTGDRATKQSCVPSQVSNREKMTSIGEGGWWLLLVWSVGGAGRAAAGGNATTYAFQIKFR